MKQSSKIPEADIQYIPLPKEEMINPIQNVTDGLSEVQDGHLQSSGFSHGMTGWRLSDNGTAEFQKLIVGSKTIALTAGKSIQSAINELATEGGGVIQLSAGIHQISTHNLVFPVNTPIRIEGENTSSTIIDFQSTDYHFIFSGTGIYTTGTVSITSGVTLTGSGTNWLSSGLVAGDQIFLDSRWYEIAAITANTTIILSEGYGGTALSGATYRAGKIAQDIEIKELTIQNSTSTSGALDFDDARNIVLEDVQLVSNNKGWVATNVSEWVADRIIVANSTGDGVTFATGSLINNRQLATVSNGGSGFVANGIKVLTVEFSSSTANTTDGYNITSCTDVVMSVQSSGNGGQGIELVSGNDNVLISDGLISGNTSDGIKLTATSDNCRISTSKIAGNGGYGVNIAASTCDNNIVVTSIFASNSSGGIYDAGTGTFLGPNIGAQNYKWIFSASDVLQASADTERSHTTATPTMKKEIVVRNRGTVRVKFDLKDDFNGASGRIYKNGSAVGTSRVATTSYVTYSEDITVAENDLLQVYIWTDGVGGHNVYTKNFRLYWTDIPAPEYTVNTD